MNKEIFKKNIMLAVMGLLFLSGCVGFTEDWIGTSHDSAPGLDPQEIMDTPYQKACSAQSGKILANETDDSLVFVFNNNHECPHDEILGKWDENFSFDDTVRVAYNLNGDTLSLSFNEGAETGEITIMLVAESALNGCLLINGQVCDSMKTGAGRLDGEWRFLPCAYINGELNCENSGRNRFIGFDVEPWRDDAYLDYRIENYYFDANLVQSGEMQVDVNSDSIFLALETVVDQSDENILFDNDVRAAYSFRGDTLLLSFNVGLRNGNNTMMLVPNSQMNGCIEMTPERKHIVDCGSDVGKLIREWKILPCTYVNGEISCDSVNHERFLSLNVDAREGRLIVGYLVNDKKEP